MSAPHLQHLAQLIANEGHAATFQSLGQYRTALLKEIAQASAAPQQEAVYQLRNNILASHWRDADKAAYESVADNASYERRILYTHADPSEVSQLRAELADALAARDKWGSNFQKAIRAGATIEQQLAEAQALLQRTHRDLDACQKVIWLAGVGSRGYGFDPAYCEDAQARLAEIDAFLSATAQPAEVKS